MRQRLGRFAGDSKPLKTSAGTWVNAGARKAARVLRFDWRKPEVATKAMLSFLSFLSFLVFGPLIVLVFDTLLFAAGFGLVRFKMAGNGCGEGDLARAVTGAGAFAGAFFFPSSAACDFDGLLTGEGVVVACGRGARFGVTGAAFGLGSSTAFTPDGLGCSVAALLDGATKSTALSMTVSSNALGAFALAPHNSLRKKSVTLESDRFAP